MKRRTFIKTGTAAAATWFVAPSMPSRLSAQGPATGALESEFLKPPAAARPHTWWHWMNGNVTADGITRDLEAMARVGVGGVQMFDVGTGIPKGPVETLSPEWLRLVRHAASEANRLGMSFTMHNCPGWSSTGGPWITPDRAMQQLVWSEAFVDGGRLVQAEAAEAVRQARLLPRRDGDRVSRPARRGADAAGRRGHGRRQAGRSVAAAGLGSGCGDRPDPGGSRGVRFARDRVRRGVRGQVRADPPDDGRRSGPARRWRTRSGSAGIDPGVLRRRHHVPEGGGTGGGRRRRSRTERAGGRQLRPQPAGSTSG